MKETRGYVFIPRMRECGQEFLFGPSVNTAPKIYENLESNGLKPFEILGVARLGAQAYARSMGAQISSIGFGYLEIRAAETEEEVEKTFAKSRDLIVIASDHTPGGIGDLLIGREVPGRPRRYPVYGAKMTLNGFKLIRNLGEAQHIAREEHRQAGLGITIARFKLRRVK